MAQLKRTARMNGKSLKQVVNEALHAGLCAHTRCAAQSYCLEPSAMGQPATDIDLVKARRISDELDDETHINYR